MGGIDGFFFIILETSGEIQILANFSDGSVNFVKYFLMQMKNIKPLDFYLQRVT